ncbi:Hypothetical predicted protein [Olea europaea subsp. europaea]|uniref:Uncharacterized protein n=1 Tax=Olea europaea subsp. europaea TaxID=158383 RepID=A0A8S0UIF9_OLEEU|nr:Hypothetical predicted protein [Olea europaea subsp. europaea]
MCEGCGKENRDKKGDVLIGVLRVAVFGNGRQRRSCGQVKRVRREKLREMNLNFKTFDEAVKQSEILQSGKQPIDPSIIADDQATKSPSVSRILRDEGTDSESAMEKPQVLANNARDDIASQVAEDRLVRADVARQIIKDGLDQIDRLDIILEMVFTRPMAAS